MAFDHSKFLARFVEEAREHCARLNEGLLNLESSSGDAEMINGLFRSAHTVKGSAKMIKLIGIAELAHRMEDVLDAVRGGKISLTASASNSLFRGVDALLAMLDRIAAGENSPEAPAALCEELAQAATSLDAPESAQVSTAAQSDVMAVPATPGTETMPSAKGPESSAGVDPEGPEPLAPSPAVLTPVAPAEEHKTEPPAARNRQVEYLRINAQKLDDLIRLMGEIVSEQGRFRRQVANLREIEHATAQHSAIIAEVLEKSAGNNSEHHALIGAGAALHLSLRQSVRAMYDASLMQDHLITDLQETSLNLRMQPLSTVFDPLRRTVRDLSKEHGKEIDFIVDGGETELDRKIIERIGDSLMHMIRNSIDHGLENVDERIAAGKPAKGVIRLSAYYDSGCVTIALSDDGKGLSADKIREKALSKRLFDADTLAGMSHKDIINIIFMPGFSTSPIITDLSGRGVGMDVVKRSIVDELKGSVNVESREGSGTTFLLRLPPNLAVFTLFLVSVNEKTCALPATSIVEMVTVQRDAIIEIVNKRAIRLREQIIPVEKLGALLKLPEDTQPEKDEMVIVIIRNGEEKLGLMVDEILGREEMVVKPLPLHLQNLRMVSGVTIGELNSIINVLHIPELFRQAHETVEPVKRVARAKEQRAFTILVVDDSLNTREIEKSILEAYGYVVVTAEDGQEAFEKTRDVLYDLVITDVEMPRLDGFSLTERLRGDDRYRNVPIIIVTSLEKDSDKKRGITVGANAYIVKGAFDQSNLLETVRSLIG